jgi:hypothetical protein
VRSLIPLTLGLLVAAPALAVDGTIEINQARALAGGITASDAAGFPVTLDTTGSYRLTGNLTVPDANTDAIVVDAENVTIDLGGFAILGITGCSGTSGNISCSNTGAGNGITATAAGFPDSTGTVVRNGTIYGMGNHCLELRAGSWVDGVLVQFCGNDGIRAEDDSLVTNNRIRLVGAQGLSAVSGEVNFQGNRIALTGGATQVNATEIGGNTCDDARCSARPKRRFYMTNAGYAGGSALTACDGGYHMATLHEIIDPSAASYDWMRGSNNLDAGLGPPAGDGAWIRTGSAVSEAASNLGSSNCALWISSLNSHFGMTVAIDVNWSDPSVLSNPWLSIPRRCDVALQVWCVQD